jgi:hypothetical protein
MKVAKGFKVELLYSVPKNEEGSWVSMCVDPKGRLIVSDQYGALYRITPPPVGAKGETKVEQIPAKIGSAQGLLWAFDALYVVVNAGKVRDPKTRAEREISGLYRVTSSKKTIRSTRSRNCAGSRGTAAAASESMAPTRFSSTPMASASRSFAATKPGSPSTTPRAFRRSGVRIICCRACRTAMAS